MALQMSLLRRGGMGMMKSAHRLGAGQSLLAPTSSALVGRRNFAADAGDVIGIDLGTTNSCVAVMVR